MNPILARLINNKFGNDEEKKQQFIDGFNNRVIYYGSLSKGEYNHFIFASSNCNLNEFISLIASFIDIDINTLSNSYTITNGNGYLVMRGWVRTSYNRYNENFVYKDELFFKVLGLGGI